MFGDRESFLDKFNTAARIRPYGEQILGHEFYSRENNKPLFNMLKLLTVHNLYYYHCLLEAFKILKYRSPISIYSQYKISQRKETLVISPEPSKSFLYRSTYNLNLIRQKLEINDFSYKISIFKTRIIKLLGNCQKLGIPDEWCDQNTKIQVF